jgi:hypothetical protein
MAVISIVTTARTSNPTRRSSVSQFTEWTPGNVLTSGFLISGLWYYAVWYMGTDVSEIHIANIFSMYSANADIVSVGMSAPTY